MSDEPTSDALSRASAYLDGELDAPEIAVVEADPTVMAEVARLRALRDSIRDVSGPTSPARETAIAAALAEFDRINQPAATVVRSKPGPNYGRWMAVAAAVAAVAALGAVITTAGRGGDSDDSPQLASAEQSAVAFDVNAADRSAPAGGAAPASAQPEAVPSQAALSAEAAIEAPAATTAAGAIASQEDAAATTAAPATTMATASAPAFDARTPIPDEAELGRVGRQLLAEWRDGLRQSVTGTACDGANPDVVLLSDAVLIVDGVSRAVLLAGNPASDEAFALDPDSCVVVMTGR